MVYSQIPADERWGLLRRWLTWIAFIWYDAVMISVRSAPGSLDRAQIRANFIANGKESLWRAGKEERLLSILNSPKVDPESKLRIAQTHSPRFEAVYRWGLRNFSGEPLNSAILYMNELTFFEERIRVLTENPNFTQTIVLLQRTFSKRSLLLAVSLLPERLLTSEFLFYLRDLDHPHAEAAMELSIERIIETVKDENGCLVFEGLPVEWVRAMYVGDGHYSSLPVGE
jgi:hypothetical protein